MTQKYGKGSLSQKEIDELLLEISKKTYDFSEDLNEVILKPEWNQQIQCSECNYIQKAFYFIGGIYDPRKMMECKKCGNYIGFNRITGELLD